MSGLSSHNAGCAAVTQADADKCLSNLRTALGELSHSAIIIFTAAANNDMGSLRITRPEGGGPINVEVTNSFQRLQYSFSRFVWMVKGVRFTCLLPHLGNSYEHTTMRIPASRSATRPCACMTWCTQQPLAAATLVPQCSWMVCRVSSWRYASKASPRMSTCATTLCASLCLVL